MFDVFYLFIYQMIDEIYLDIISNEQIKTWQR
eukprot:UN06573